MKLQALIGNLGILSCALVASGGSLYQPLAPMVAWQQRVGGASAAGNADSTDPRAWFAKGQAALQAGDLDAAEAEFRKVVAADPRSGAAYANLGVIAMRRKHWDQALTLLQKAERLDPKMTGIRLNIGLVKYRRGDYAGAIAPFASVVRDQADSQQASYLLGLCYLFTEHYGDTVAVLEPLWPQQSNNFMYLYVLGIAAHKVGRKDLDEKALNQLVAVGGEAPEFHLILGKAYLNRGEPEKAIPEFEQAASANPNLPYLHFSMGMAYLRLDNNEAAEAEFRKDLEVEPDLPDTYEQLGEFYSRAGNNEEAAKFFHEALQRNPRMPGALFGAAKIYSQEQKYREALTAVNSVVRLAPQNQAAHFLRGQVLARLGRREEAQAEFAMANKILNTDLNKRRESLGNNPVPNPELAEPPQ